MKLISKDLTLAALSALPIGEQDDLALAFVKGNVRLKDTKDEQKEGAKVIGKLLVVLQCRLNKAKEAMVVAADATLAEYFKTLYGAPVQTHPLSLKNAFAAFVATGRITEKDYDVNSGNCLELAARIVTAVGGDLEHDAVKRAAEQLTERSNKEAKNLRDILASVKPAAKMTPEEALESFQAIYEDGQLAVVLAQMPDMVSKAPETTLKDIYLSFSSAAIQLDKVAGPRLDAWLAETAAKTAPVKLITAETEDEADPSVPTEDGVKLSHYPEVPADIAA